MKGISLVGELISFLFMVVLGYFLGGLIVYTHRLSPIAPGNLLYDLTVEATTIPVKHEDMLLAFLETTYNHNGQKIPMKTLITEVAIQKNRSIRINGIDDPIDIGGISRSILRPYEPEQGFLLRLVTGNEKINLAWDLKTFIGNKQILKIQKVSVKIYTPFRETADLELYVS